MKKYQGLFFLASILAAGSSYCAQPKGPEMLAYPASEIGEQGNWRKKKDWLKLSFEKVDAIQKYITEAQTLQQTITQKANVIDSKVDTFYRQSGFNKGEISTLLNEVQADLQKAKKTSLELFSLSLERIDEETEEEAKRIKEQYESTQSIEEEFKAQKRKLAKLKLSMEEIEKLDGAIRSRLAQLNTQINTMKQEADKARQMSQGMWHIIDHTKARDKFYQISSMDEKIKNIQDYLSKTFSADFSSVAATMETQIKKTGTAIESLEDDGLIIKNRAERLEEQQKNEMAKLKEKQARLKKARRKKRLAKKAPPQSFLGSIWSWIKSFFFG